MLCDDIIDRFAGLRAVVASLAAELGVKIGVADTPEESVDAMRAADENIGLLSIRSYRPSALAAVRTALQGAKRVVVLEKKLFCRAGRRRVG